MADDAKTPGNGAVDPFEQKKKEALGQLLDHAVAFTAADVGMVKKLEELLGLLVEQVKRNPDAMFAGGADIDALIKAMKARSGNGGESSGGDVTGALGWHDIVDTIHALEGFLKDEKKFIMDILRLIFCGCSGNGW